MQIARVAQQLKGILEYSLPAGTANWLNDRLGHIVASSSARDLYLTHSLLGSRVPTGVKIEFPAIESELRSYLETHGASLLEITRIYLLCRVLEENSTFFKPKVAQLIQLADTGELETFLRYLVLLPDAEAFKQVAVEALRTNIATVFDSIALDNPYPALYFNEQQWNQMYLKAAFMQRDLGKIREVDRMANKELARIISDYAHERWAASRDVDPLFWRPVGAYLEGRLLDDMQRLLQSDLTAENRAGALCCVLSGNSAATELLKGHSDLVQKIKDGTIHWNNLKE